MMGCTCPDCKEWFEVICQTGSIGLIYCPLCGFMATSDDDWEWDEDNDEEA